MNGFQIAYTVLGGLGVFFFGMKLMSDALQQAASDVITKVINSLTSNRFLAVLVGMVVTMIVQSSSVTTVMVVGFVNAGLMQLGQAIGVILGSNIGTTITGWIISIKIGKYGLLLIGLGIFPTLFAKNEKIREFGKVLFGVGMIFFGLEIMSDAFKPLRSNDEFLSMISYFSGQDYLSYFASVITGCLLTVIIQSSSAMLGITIALASSGVISFGTAVALVLGENIGTTITAILASVGTSTNAKRAARAHAIFNILGVMIVFTIIPYWINLIEWIIPGLANFADADGSFPNVAAHIAASHTLFNVTATIVFLPFLNQLTKLVTKLTPEREGEELEPKHFVMVGDSEDILPATSIIQADRETAKMVDILERMYTVHCKYFETLDEELLKKMSNYEDITDNIQKEITLFLCHVMEKPLSSSQSYHTQALIKIVDELESIADYLERITVYRGRLKNELVDGPALEDFLQFQTVVWEFFRKCCANIPNFKVLDYDQIYAKSEELRVWADDMRDKHIERVSKGEYAPLTALTFSDMVVALRKVRAHAMNIATARKELNNED